MTEQELRALVRSVIDRQLAQASSAAPAPAGVAAAARAAATARPAPPFALPPASAPDPGLAFARYLTLVNANGGACVIEPTVTCNHCGYCQTHGH